MDRRSWLWRRKSSEKSPGETESSGSISSHSERFSDEQAYPNHNTQSPEVTSKSAPSDEEVNDSVKSLTEKLAAALLNISAKEDLVKQHAKVAEEAVSGWERAENEVLSLKQQLEAATQKNSALEDRIGHLDGALKECVRQIRQAREDQEKKIHEAVDKRTLEWESTKSELESQLTELQAQLQSAKAKVVASMAMETDLRPKLEAVEEENSVLKHELFSRAEELEIRIIERDLSTRVAETASKQHLESIKKVAKLESECRRLKAMARKASPANDNRSFTASSVYVESFTDSQSDSGERLMAIETDTRKMSGLELIECEPGRSNSQTSALITELNQFKNEKAPGRNLMVPSGEINLMDDFLEMERLAALPETESESSCHEAGAVSHQSNSEESSKAELDAMSHRTAELEEKLQKMEAEKVEVKMALTECQKQLEISQSWLKEAEMKLLEQQTQLALANVSKRTSEEEVWAANAKREMAESQLRDVEDEIKTLLSKVRLLEEEIEKERALSVETAAKCQKLEDELSRIKHDAELRHATSSNGDLKIKQEKELQVAASKLAECQQTIASLGRQLKSLATLEDFLIDSEEPLELNGEGSVCLRDGEEPWKLHPSDLYLPKIDSESSKVVGDCLSPPKNGREISTEKSRNGFGKLFPRVKMGIRNENQ